MFFLKTLHKELQLHPKYFGPHLRHVVQKSLIEDVEGTSMGKDGYVITVTRINDIGAFSQSLIYWSSSVLF